MTEKKEIPLYTRIGSKVTAVVMLLLIVFLARNCATSIYYGATTDQEVIARYYTQGYRDGMSQALSGEASESPETANPLLQKAYRKGYREGWDTGRKHPK